MNGFFIAGYVLFGLMCVLGIIYLITLLISSKAILFTKTKYSWPAIVIYGLVFVILLIAGILFLTTLQGKLNNENNYLHAGLCFGFMGLDVLNIVGYFIIVQVTNKHKIPYDMIPKTDFKPALAQIKAKLGDEKVVKDKLLKYHKNYYNRMILAYSEVLKSAKDKNILLSKKYADIVMFNETFAHKWCTLMNNYQLLLTYEFLTLI